MSDSVEFRLPRRVAVKACCVLIPIGLFFCWLGRFLHQQNPYGSLLTSAVDAWPHVCAIVCVILICLSTFIPLMRLTSEGIFINNRGSKRKFFGWNEHMTVERKSGNVILMGDGDDSPSFLILEMFMVDPRFRAAVVRWAPPGHPLLAYLPKAG